MIAPPLATTLMPSRMLTHCDWCLTNLTMSAPLECHKCSSVIYCHAKCRRNATNSHHQFECALNAKEIYAKENGKKSYGNLELMFQTMRTVIQSEPKSLENYVKIIFSKEKNLENFDNPLMMAASMMIHLDKLNLLEHLTVGIFMLFSLMTSGYNFKDDFLWNCKLPKNGKNGKTNGVHLKMSFETKLNILGVSLIHLYAVMETNNHSFQGKK